MKKLLLLKKSAHMVLMTSLEKAIWNWMDTYPNEFADVQVIKINSCPPYILFFYGPIS